MANKQRVNTSYDSGEANTATGVTGGNNEDAPEVKSDDKLQELLKMFKKGRDFYKNNYEEAHQEYWKCYQGMRTRRGYEGISDDFVPETFTIIESVKSNIAGGKPKFMFMPMNDNQRQDTEVLNNLMDYYWDCNRMTQKTQNWVQDMLIYGTGILNIAWENDKPRITNIPLSDFFVDPTAVHLNNPDEPGYPKYAGHRFLTDIDALKAEMLVDPETGEMTQKYSNLDDIQPYDEEWDKLDKDVKEQFLGSTLGKDAPKEQIEGIVLYTVGPDAKKYVIANRNTIIYEGPNPYQREEREEERTTVIDGEEVTAKVPVPAIKPFLPYAALRNYVDSSLFYAKGDVAVIIDRQETLNDISNQKQDNITYVLNNMWQIDPQFSHLADQIESLPGAVFPIPRGALNPIEKTVVTQEGDAEMMRIKDEMRRATAADEVIQGVSQEKGRVTATEIQAQLNQATQRFSTKLNTLESEGYAQLARIIFKMVQMFVTQEMAVRVVGPDGVVWKDLDPNEYSGDYEPKVVLETTNKMMKAEEGQKYAQVHQLVAQSPYVDQRELVRVYLEKMLDLPEQVIKRLLDVQNPAPMPAGGQVPAENPMSGVPSGPLPT